MIESESHAECPRGRELVGKDRRNEAISWHRTTARGRGREQSLIPSASGQATLIVSSNPPRLAFNRLSLGLILQVSLLIGVFINFALRRRGLGIANRAAECGRRGKLFPSRIEFGASQLAAGCDHTSRPLFTLRLAAIPGRPEPLDRRETCGSPISQRSDLPLAVWRSRAIPHPRKARWNSRL